MVVGRPCSVCQHSRLRDISEALSIGASVSTVAARYGLSQSALFRHQRNHLPNETRTITLTQYAEDTNDILGRVLEIANDSRNLRRAGMASGNSLAAIRGSQAELQAIQLLGDRYGVDNESMLANAEAFLNLTKAVIDVARVHPKVASAIFEAMPAGTAPEFLAEIRKLMKPIEKAEITP